MLVEAVAGREAEIPCALVRGHAPFCWGPDPAATVEIAVTLEEVARLALLTRCSIPSLARWAMPSGPSISSESTAPRSYYGQP